MDTRTRQMFLDRFSEEPEVATPSPNYIRDLVILSIIAGMMGALFGYGFYVTIQAACIGAGMGLGLFPALVILIASVSGLVSMFKGE